jgi:hypothetical protein
MLLGRHVGLDYIAIVERIAGKFTGELSTRNLSIARCFSAGATLRLLIVLLLTLTTLSLAPRTRAQGFFPRRTTIYLQFVENEKFPGRLTNANVIFAQMQTFFNSTLWEKGVEYSFIGNVLDFPTDPKPRYVDTPQGFGYGINAGAVLLNKLIYTTAWWDIDGIEKPLFQRIESDPLRFDRSYDVFGVNIRRPNTDYRWRLNINYDGANPRLVVAFDPERAIASLTVEYDDETQPPSRKLSLREKGLILGSNLRDIIGDRRLGVSVVPVASPADTVDVNAELQIPVASAWKGGAIVYFFENVDRAVWSALPVKYWNIRNINRIPREYQDAFAKHNEILRWVYVAGVFSGNHEAGNVVDYVWRNSKWKSSPNAIAAFNDWSQQAVGLTAKSGMHRWLAGRTENPAIMDYRLNNRQFIDNGRLLPFDNTFSPHDLALYYYHLATTGKRMGYYNTAMELLTTKTDILSMLKGFTADTGIVVASKIGYFSPTSPEAYGHDVNTDAGLLTLPNGEQFAIATMAFDTVPLQGDVLSAVTRALTNLYQSTP